MKKKLLVILSTAWMLTIASCSTDPVVEKPITPEATQNIKINLNIEQADSKTRAVIGSVPAEKRVDDVWIMILADNSATPSTPVVLMKELTKIADENLEYSTTIEGSVASKITNESKAYVVANINDNAADKDALKNIKTYQELQNLKFKVPMSDKAVLTANSFLNISSKCDVKVGSDNTISITDTKDTAVAGTIKLRNLSSKIEVKRGLSSALSSVVITGGNKTTGLFGAVNDPMTITDLGQNIGVGGTGAPQGSYYLYPNGKIEVSLEEVGGNATMKPVVIETPTSGVKYVINAGGLASYLGCSEGITHNGLTFESKMSKETISFLMSEKATLSLKDATNTWISFEKKAAATTLSSIVMGKNDILNVILSENKSAPRSGVVVFEESGQSLEITINQNGTEIKEITLNAPGELTAKLASINTKDLIINGAFLNSADTLALKTYIKTNQVLTLTLRDVETLQNRTFEDCKTLTSLTIPKLKSIGEATFKKCSKLASVSTLNALLEKITTIPKEAFSGCSVLDINGNMPEVTKIGENSFNGCKAITSVILPNVTTIEGYSFMNCSKLVSVKLPETIPSRIFSLGTAAFMGCTALKHINFPTNMYPLSLLSGTFQGCTSLETISSDKISQVGQASFLGCKALKNVSFDNVVGLGKNAFGGSGLLTITLPLLTTLADYSFAGSANIKSIIVPSATMIVENSFIFCPSLTALAIKGVTDTWYRPTIHANAFGGGAVPSLFLCGENGQTGSAQYPNIEALRTKWENWGGHQWPNIYSNYKGTGAKDDPANYNLHWKR